MNTVTSLNEWRFIRANFGRELVGFVPTMGYLHEGHLSLIQRAKTENEIVVVSIFVNPTQFNQNSDFEKYPRAIERDQQLLSDLGVDYLLLPEAGEMYPDQYSLQVSELELSATLEGEYRPGHFNGMLTVVLKLLNLVQSHKAYFGEKDYQQYLLIKKMAAAFFMNTEIVACPTLRAADGLALSSRNVRLTEEQRKQAALFPKILQESATAEFAHQALVAAGFAVDYVADQWNRRLSAVWLDEVRLIDNVKIA
ncbi:MAG TPA: pantoate--beta-alanine ligase [Coxiellaceae bacterium]|nr:pantoate--beta-alanine ligase [Coxiellaceae bacterium]